ncbi:hypothetical protein LguiB_029631 [Lonicera macranthoides]
MHVYKYTICFKIVKEKEQEKKRKEIHGLIYTFFLKNKPSFYCITPSNKFQSVSSFNVYVTFVFLKGLLCSI